MKKLNIAIITGGNVAERGVSLKSGQTIFNNLNDTKYNGYLIDFDGKNFIEMRTQSILDKNDFSFHQGEEKIQFDLAFLMLHGHPAEDGVLQGFLEIIGLPYTGCDHFVSSLTFDKQACKTYLKNFDIPMAASQLIRKGQAYHISEIEKMRFPLFVKPNKNGSSYGITKVLDSSSIDSAIQKAFQFDNEVIIESFLQGNEYSNGAIRKGNEIIVLPITEIISENEFFDYAAKYEEASQEITPANLSPEESATCQALTKKIYEILNCDGVVRIDYIKVGEIFYFLEANTIPGFSEQSIYPQQTIAHGWTISYLLDILVEECLGKRQVAFSR